MSQQLNLFEMEVVTLSIPTPTPQVKSEEMEVSEGLEINEQDSQQVDRHLQVHIMKVIEALLFSSSDPIPLTKIREITDTILPIKPKLIRQLLDELKEEYVSLQRSFRLEEIAQGYVLRTHEEYSRYIDLLHYQRRGEKLSPAATEVLAIIAYRQPVTRPQIDAIRGVDSSGTVNQLLERELIESVGKLEVPGRPTLYATTKEFLKHYGLKDIKELKKSNP